MIQFINKWGVGCHGGVCSVSSFPARETAVRAGRRGLCSANGRSGHFVFQAFGRKEGERKLRSPPRSGWKLPLTQIILCCRESLQLPSDREVVTMTERVFNVSLFKCGRFLALVLTHFSMVFHYNLRLGFIDITFFLSQIRTSTLNFIHWCTFN